ncbi:MAG: 3'-5' exonuclease [Campylobacter sp.]|nr:3'-5' exonuclease [Campylobacter sp.]
MTFSLEWRRIFNKFRLKNREFEFMFKPYNGDEIVSFDCETTGLDTKNDEIVSIGAVIIKGDKILTSKKFEIYLKPQKELKAKSVTVHHLRACDIKDGYTQAKGVSEFLNFIENKTLLGYYAEFDVAMINRVFKEISGTKLPNKVIEISALYHDKKQKLIPDSFVNLSYDAILKDLDLPYLSRHSALNDAIMDALIYIKLKNSL